jgi:outer membrane protein assembly factor BamB
MHEYNLLFVPLLISVSCQSDGIKTNCQIIEESSSLKRGKNLKKERGERITIAIVALLLISSTIVLLSNSAGPATVSASTSTIASQDLNPATGQTYGDIMQYEWPDLGGYTAGTNTRSSPGPAPDAPNLLWTSPTTYGAIYAVFNGKAFSISGGKLYALDAFTGSLIWSTTLAYGGADPQKIDDTYMFVDSTNGTAIYRISDGTYVSRVDAITNTITGWSNPGAGQYYPGTYDMTTKMKFRVQFGLQSNITYVTAISMTDPLNPTIAWRVPTDEASEIHCVGEGKVFIGSYSGYVMYALNQTNGELLWKAHKDGICGYTALYYEGAVYHSGGTKCLTAYNATNGDILWNYNFGGTIWAPHGIMAAYGRIYQHVINEGATAASGIPMGYYYCFDAQTGELLWKTENNLMGGYWTPAVADGKIYTMTLDGPNWAGTNPLAASASKYTWSAYDAFTGTTLWSAYGNVANFVVAYGNLYGGNTVYGSPYSAAKDWSYSRGNDNTPGVAVGQHGSLTSADTIKWTYTTGGAVTASPVIVNGKVYIGSYDGNLYCLNYNTGSLVWTFPTQWKAASTVAVSGGRVYTGADDGYIYCINAETGTQIWKTNIYGGNVPDVHFEVDTAEVRSSPIIVGDKLYVGALDGKVYCLSTSDGSIKWTYTTNGQIGGSPTYSNGIVYITSVDRNLYALDASSGNKLWTWTTPRYKTPAGINQMFFVGTPTVASGKIFIGTGGRSLSGPPAYACLNATTGAQLWLVVTDSAGNSNQPYAITYYNGILYGEAHMSAVAFNATTGAEIWSQWLGHQVYTNPLYVDDPSGAKVYYGCDSYSITCFNATNGRPLSLYVTDAQVYSSPAIYAGKIYVGSADCKVYCFDDTPKEPTSIFAVSNKGEEMWSNETIMIKGQVLGTTVGTVFRDLTTIGDVDSSLHPGIPNATVQLVFTKPDMTSMNITATTDKFGYFTASYNPNIVGSWGWVAYYQGQKLPYLTYDEAYSQWTAFNVIAAPVEATPTPVVTPTPTPVVTPTPTPEVTPTPTATPETGTSPTTTYIIVAVIVVIIIAAIGAYVYTTRKKKKPKT